MTDESIWADCPLCGKKVRTQSKYANNVTTVITECECGLTFTTVHPATDQTQSESIHRAEKNHRRWWNTRQYQRDLIDIGVYARNILERTKEYSYLKKD